MNVRRLIALLANLDPAIPVYITLAQIKTEFSTRRVDTEFGVESIIQKDVITNPGTDKERKTSQVIISNEKS